MTCSLTVSKLKELLTYNPETGVFIWNIQITSLAKNKSGDIAGHKQNGYKAVMIDGKRYYLHRLAWLYIHGEFPTFFIDHINGIRTDNRLINLRQVNFTGNICNQRKAQKQNTTGYLGVTRFGERFRANINYMKKRYHLGIFGKAEDAHAAYLEAKRKLHSTCSI